MSVFVLTRCCYVDAMSCLGIRLFFPCACFHCLTHFFIVLRGRFLRLSEPVFRGGERRVAVIATQQLLAFVGQRYPSN